MSVVCVGDREEPQQSDPCQHPGQDTRLTGTHRPPDLFKPDPCIPDRCMPNPCQHTYQDNRLTGTSTTGNQTLVFKIQDPCQYICTYLVYSN